MRLGTGLVLIALILLFAAFGWKAFGVLALFGLALVLAAIAIVAAAVWKVRKGMREALRRLEQAMPGPPAGAGGPPPGNEPGRPDAIDVPGRVVRKPRDGADTPEELDEA